MFEIAEQSDTGLIRFDGWWIHTYATDALPQQRRHKHFFHKKAGRLDACTEKWAVVPAKSPEDVQWAIHNVIGMVPDQAGFKVGLRHFKPINTSLGRRSRTCPTPSGPSCSMATARGWRSTRICAGPWPGSSPTARRSSRSRPLPGRPRSRPTSTGCGAKPWPAAGRVEDAVGEARRAAELLPDHPATLLHLGKLLRVRGDEEEVLRLAEEAQRLRQADPLYHVQMGRSGQHTGAIDEAVASLRTALALDPDSIDAAELLFKLFWGHGRYGEGRALARTGSRARRPAWPRPRRWPPRC